MTLSCSCNEPDDDSWWYSPPSDFTTLNTTKRKRCCSCKELINIGSVCTEFYRWRNPISDIEYRIYGDGGEIGMASWYMCEWCSEMYFNFDELGYCHYLGDSMVETLEEYKEMEKDR